jgi:hypothetical protein
MDHLHAMARATMTSPDYRTLDGRGIHQVRADCFVDLLMGADPTVPAAQGGAGAVEPGLRKSSVVVHADLLTLLRLNDHPGEFAGYGPVVTEMMLKTIDHLIDTPGTVWRFVITDQGRVIHEDRLHRRPTSAQKNYVRARDTHCQAPGCRRPAHQCDIDHIIDWAKLGEAGLAKYWPNNPWYKPYTGDSPAVYYPNLNIGGATFGKGSWWSYRPRKYSYQGSVSHDKGRHYMKAGMAYRHAYEYSQLPNLGSFPFTADFTAETYNAPNTLLYGSSWATFLLGSINNSLTANYVSPRYTKQDQYGLFFQDDFKLNRRVTLNLGLRWEYETAPSERLGRLARELDLTSPIPEFQANPPVMPP